MTDTLYSEACSALITESKSQTKMFYFCRSRAQDMYSDAVNFRDFTRDVKTSSDKELKFRMIVKQSQILAVQYVNSRQHTGK